ncbi:hypothetical protein HDU99_009513 [Rhizoclosmatium hyalinum]|nr:hypothetical protein HDU99_009513 [Rhizoclosmatium hyalinum]
MFGSGVGAATRAATAGAHGRSVADSKYGAKKDVKFSAGTLKAKSDTEGLNGWGSARTTTGLRAVSTTGSRTESIRDAIRARIKERDLGQM